MVTTFAPAYRDRFGVKIYHVMQPERKVTCSDTWTWSMRLLARYWRSTLFLPRSSYVLVVGIKWGINCYLLNRMPSLDSDLTPEVNTVVWIRARTDTRLNLSYRWSTFRHARLPIIRFQCQLLKPDRSCVNLTKEFRLETNEPQVAKPNDWQ